MGVAVQARPQLMPQLSRRFSRRSISPSPPMHSMDRERHGEMQRAARLIGDKLLLQRRFET